MPEQKVRSRLEETAKDAIFFEPIYPPQHDTDLTNFFGGKPLLPADIEWPVHEIVVKWDKRPNEEGQMQRTEISAPVASTFVGQINLSELPDSGAKDELPKSGMLYFFFDSATSELQLPEKPGTGGKVIYHAGDACDIPEREEPAQLGACFGEEAWYYFEWLKFCTTQEYGYPRGFPRCTVRPFVVKTFGRLPLPLLSSKDTPEQRNAKSAEHNAFHNAKSELEEQQLNKSFPAPIERNYFVGQDDMANWRGGAGFPFTWICIEIFFGNFLVRVDKFQRETIRNAAHPKDPETFAESGAATYSQWLAKKILAIAKRSDVLDVEKLEHSVREQLSEILELKEEAESWIERARHSGRYAQVPDEARSEFFGWYEKTAASSGEKPTDPRHLVVLVKHLAEAYRIGPRLCLSHSAEAAEAIPSWWIEDQKWQYAVNVSGHGGRKIKHQLLGQTGYDAPNGHVLLMQFDSQDGLDWMWCDVGVIQYWIRPEDLKNQHFEDVIVTTIGG